MNPVTRQLLVQIDDRRVVRFVEHWDALEQLIIRVYKADMATSGDAKTYRRLRRRLHRLYERFEDDLAPYWPQTTINGEAVTGDPFAALIASNEVADYIGAWDMMQRLPAARQALNHWLLDRVHDMSPPVR